MLQDLRRRRENEEGFTLIELMVVVLIIAILIAIAIPTFLGAQDRARDRGAQSDLRNALTAAKTVATDQEGFFRTDSSNAIDASAMEDTEPSLDFLDGWDAATQEEVGVETIGTGVNLGQQIFMARLSASGTYFGISTNQQGGTFYCKSDTAFTSPPTAASCADEKW